ncbi:MAG: restriction endonuclease subunit S [Nitrososphaerota archaeon]|nr:restriction endonuclease subunit S [Nitrososphaerota archaeon]
MMFYKETDFKVTDIGRIPSDWNVESLGNVVSLRSNQARLSVTEVAFIPMELVPDDGIYARYEIRDTSKVSSHTYCEAGDLLLAKITPSLENGKQGVVPEDIPNGFALATTEVFPLYCKTIDKMFLFYLLKHREMRRVLENSMRATTGRLRVPREALEGLRIPYPRFPDEQHGIAEVLSTVDDAIQKTNEVIAKTERLKRGLMQELLTKGIGHKEFKDTEIGRMPKEWGVRTIGDICDILDSQRVPLNEQKRQKMKGTIPYYGANGVVDYVNDYIFDDKLILLAEDGGYFAEYVARPIAYMVEGKCWVNNHAHVLRVREASGVVAEYLLYSVEHRNILPFIKGTTRSKLNQEELRKIPVPKPPFDEQLAVAEVLSTVDEAIQKAKTELVGLSKVKQGLMDLLLTGKVRVRVS